MPILELKIYRKNETRKFNAATEASQVRILPNVTSILRFLGPFIFTRSGPELCWLDMSEPLLNLNPSDRATRSREIDSDILALIQKVASADQLPTAEPWAGTSVLICAPGQDWSNSPNTSAYASNGMTWVVTEYVEPLSWCFLQLQNILSPHLDYVGSRDVFSHLADASIDFLGRTSAGELNFQPDARAKALLLFVLQCARRLVANPA